MLPAAGPRQCDRRARFCARNPTGGKNHDRGRVPESNDVRRGGLTLFFVLTAFLSIIAAAKAEDAPFAFHAYLAAAARVAAVIAILTHYHDRPAALPPQEINGKPNDQLGPVRLATALAVFWGIAGMLVGPPSNWRGPRSTSIPPGSISAASGRCTHPR